MDEHSLSSKKKVNIRMLNGKHPAPAGFNDNELAELGISDREHQTLYAVDLTRCSYMIVDDRDGSVAWHGADGEERIWNPGALRGDPRSNCYVCRSILDAFELKDKGERAVFAERPETIKEAEGKLVLLTSDEGDERIAEGWRAAGIDGRIEIDGGISSMQSAELGEWIDRKEADNGYIGARADEIVKAWDAMASLPSTSTGIPGLDALIGGGLSSELYVLGALPSYGKTTLALQIADAVASAGRPAVYFSLEQPTEVLLAKIIARRERAIGREVMARQLYSRDPGERRSPSPEVMEDIRSPSYRLVVKYLGARQGDRDAEGFPTMTAGRIRAIALDVKEREGTPPVVIVDYLQKMSGDMDEGTQKARIDGAIDALRELCDRHGCPVLLLSSMNRRSYYKPVALDAFAGSGGIEYAADVLLGLDYKIVVERDAEGGKATQADLEAAREESPRRMRLSLIKGRTLELGSIDLDYYSKYDTFEEAVQKKQLGDMRLPEPRD